MSDSTTRLLEATGRDVSELDAKIKHEQEDGRQLLDDIRSFIRRYVVLPTVVDDADLVGDLLALWVLHTHTFEASWATPYLRITSATPESAKTLLLEILAAICRDGWHAVNPSVAVLYRKVDADRPTLLPDEMDNYPLSDRKDALAVLNAGYKRGARVPRCNEKGELCEFSCYCPKAYAGLDNESLVPTLLSRSITIRMETKRRSETVERWIGPLVEDAVTELYDRCETWALENLGMLTDRQPDLLDLQNRRAEVWWPLLAIGEHVGGEWLERAQVAAMTLGTGGDDADTPSPQVQLLTDIKSAFGSEKTIFTQALIEHLNDLEESPWGARRKGEGLDGRGLARMLRPFKIKSKQVRVGERTAKGYHLDQFEDAFDRHLPPVPEKGKHAEHGKHPAPVAKPDVSDVSDVSHSERAPAGAVNTNGKYASEAEAWALWVERNGDKDGPR
jgi:hypothetical protein